MSWSSIIGQERVKILLKRALQSKQVAHAYLFCGSEGIGKDAIALEFAKALNCANAIDEACDECADCKSFSTLQHPNLKLIFALPVGKNEKMGDDAIGVLSESQVADVREQIAAKAKDAYHTIEIDKANFIKINSVRNLKREASMSRVARGKKIFVVLNAEDMNVESSNSLLKTLEEPLPDTILLLTTSAKDKLLPTILSRCQQIQCDLLQEEQIENALISRDGVSQSVARLASQLANGSYRIAKRLSQQNMAEERSSVVDFLRLVVGNNKTALVDAIDEIASEGDKLATERWLKLLQSWLRDALLIQQKVQAVLLEEEKQSVNNFVTKFKFANLPFAIKAVDKAISNLHKNAYLNLVITSLAIELNKYILEK